jgi:hypothetical protein
MLKVANSIINASRITGVLPVVNGGTGVTTSTGTGNTVLSATPTLSGDVSLSTGNLVISTAGKGIDFSATSGTGTSELLADYEEGTWTPADGSGAGLVLTVGACTYTKVGRLVTVIGTVTYPVTASASNMLISGLPFSLGAGNYASMGSIGYTSASTTLINYLRGTAAFFQGFRPGAITTNVEMSGNQLDFSLTYFA